MTHSRANLLSFEAAGLRLSVGTQVGASAVAGLLTAIGGCSDQETEGWGAGSTPEGAQSRQGAPMQGEGDTALGSAGEMGMQAPATGDSIPGGATVDMRADMGSFPGVDGQWGEPGPLEVEVDGGRVLAAPARYRHHVNGAIAVSRPSTAKRWSSGDGALLVAVAEHLGIAIEQIANQATLKRLSRTDELTGLPNRRGFMTELRRRHAHALRTGRPAALLYTDLDNFKLVNDTHGHQRGDAALKAWVEVVSQRMRASDVFARLGGDEFAAWLEEAGEAAAIAKAADLLAASKRLESYSGDPERPLRVSIGIAVFDPVSEERLDGLLARADAAMYRAKNGGKGNYALAPPAVGANEEGDKP